MFIFLLSSQSKASEVPFLDLWQKKGLCTQDVEYSQDYLEVKGKNIYGEYWKCKGKGGSIQDFKIFLENKGFKVFDSSEEVLEAYKNIEQGKLYIRYSQNEDYSLHLLKQTILVLNKKLELDIPDNGEEIHFYLDYPKDSYLSLKLEMGNNASLDIEAYDKLKKGELKTEIIYRKEIKQEEGLTHVLYDIPIRSGLQHWFISIRYTDEKI